MNKIRYIYNDPMMGQMMPPMQNRPHGWRERVLRNFGKGASLSINSERTIPNWIVGKSIVFFFVALSLCLMAFGYVPGFNLILVASISVVLFFYAGQSMTKSWTQTKERGFLKNVFISSFVIRIIWILYLYYIFNPEYYGSTFGSSEDVEWYMPFGEEIAQWVRDGFKISFSDLMHRWVATVDDVGYPIWLGVVYLLTGSQSDVFVPLVVKALIGSYCAICIYHVAKRHFGEGVARMAAIFICVNPNMIYWCGNMMKEAEMVFLVCLSVDLMDKALTRNSKLTITSLLPGVLAAFYLFFFRAALGMVIFLAVFAHLVMASNKVMGFGKKFFAGLLVAATLLVGAGDSIRYRVENVVSAAQSATSGGQAADANWRANRVDGGGRKQSFAKYAGAAVFAPLIFTIPFPTFNEANVAQIVQVQLAGGSYIKNVLSFFVIMVMIVFLISGEWRRHVFIIAYTMGYLMCLVLSTFAQSGRFHMPVWPMLMLFAAYGIQLAKGNARMRRMYTLVLVLEVIVCLGWNWFKLKGRGMI